MMPPPSAHQHGPPQQPQQFQPAPLHQFQQYQQLPQNMQQQTAPTPGAAAAAPAPSSEPNVDVDLHVKISISSGRCVLHTESENIKQTGNRTMGRDKSFSGNIFSTESPSMSRKGTNAGLRSATGGERGSGNDYRTYSQRTAHRDFRHQNVTTIYIPSLDVRVHYISKNEMEELVCFDSSI